MQGKVFSIEEFSIYDGPGIRTTVFLKGCPLQCEWCHSPEGQSFATEILKSPNGCTECGACLQAGKEECGIPTLTVKSISACPRNLLRLCGNDHTPEELTALLEKNLPLLKLNGGGVTFSGGEPTAQAEFLTACLRLLEGKTHRALQTCGYCAPQIFRSLLEHCDYVLYDIKLMDPALHRRYCGVSNEWILENYEALVSSGVAFCTRLPLIPGVTDTEENLSRVAAFLTHRGVKYLEMMPYHALTGSKYALAGREYAPSFDGSRESDPHIAIFSSHGIEVKIL